MKKIFISYSHDSEEHAERVLGLSNKLRNDGLDCVLDQYVVNPDDGWPKWMDRQLQEAEQVIVVCTQTCYNRVMGKEPKGKGKGVKWESTLAYQYIYDDDSKNNRFIPVVFDNNDAQYIPPILKGVNYYVVDNEKGYDKLYRRLTGQPEVIPPELGTIKKRPPKETPDDFLAVSSVDKPRISISKLPVSGEHLFGREKRLQELDEAWTDDGTCVTTLIAWGGVGKTALVNRWLCEMGRDNYRGARRVYGWSFYSQGAQEGKQASADEFFQDTLVWFGDENPKVGAPEDKGRRLARLVRNETTLLILDGLEPLQYPPGELHGFDGLLKDKGMRAFLRELAAGFSGLCIITSRETVADLADRKNYTVKEMALEHLSEKAGVAFLKALGVTGPEKEMVKAVREYDGHALALTLLGRYIKRIYKGDIRKRDTIPALTRERIQGGHARRVMQAYEQWLGDSAEKDILYIMGLFDRPAEGGAIEALKADPAIPGVTEQLQRLAEHRWQEALTNLREARLLAQENPQKSDTLDCHPLVREFFGEKLQRANPKGWTEAHKRLYNYFKDLPEKDLPDTLSEMEPLFTAVAHGCRAGLYNEARYDVYWKRIKRGDDHYCTQKLGAFGADLAALSNFFDIPWSQPAAGLPDREKAVILSWAAFRLRAVGRLREAAQPMKAGLDMRIKQEVWKSAAINASNLSELKLTLGEVTEAVDYGRESVRHADRSGDAFHQESKRTTLADALHQAGERDEAEKWFREAEEKQKERQPQYPFLYSLPGYRYCDLLLGKGGGAYQEVLERAEKTIEIAKRNRWLLDISLDNLTLGRAWMKKTVHEKSGDFSRAMHYLDRAVTGLREAGQLQYLAPGLIIRAECYRLQEQFSKAWNDLNEAEEIAASGDMKLWLVDYHLEAGRVRRAEGEKADAVRHFETAKQMIAETGYHRRNKGVEG
jgi:tetratricopeptide (TPR) repeat protein